MNKFEEYLIQNGIHFQTAGGYGNIVVKYLEWLKVQGVKPKNVKRSLFAQWLKECRDGGNKERTIIAKQIAVAHYYFFLGVKRNPAVSWLRKKRPYTLPSATISREDLQNIYNSFVPKSPADYRDRCMLGMVLFQGLKRAELQELRISDIDFEKCDVFIQGQLKTNSRRLKLESFQMFHLYDYFNKYRKAFLINKPNQQTDKFFLSKGVSKALGNAIGRMLKKVKMAYPHVEDLRHIRGSLITHWQNEEGTVEAMVKAGHRYISSTQRFQTTKYEELQDMLKTLHPLEKIDL